MLALASLRESLACCKPGKRFEPEDNTAFAGFDLHAAELVVALQDLPRLPIDIGMPSEVKRPHDKSEANSSPYPRSNAPSSYRSGAQAIGQESRRQRQHDVQDESGVVRTAIEADSRHGEDDQPDDQRGKRAE